jgi:DNA polymerase elongation subunit (family B)
MAYQNIYVDQSQEQRVVYVWDDTKGMIVYPEKDFRYAYVADPSGNKRSMTGQRVSKTTRFTRNHPSIFESDLPIETRVLTDLYLNEDTVSTGNVTLFVDIEVSMNNQMPIVKEGNNEITSIAMMDSVSNRYMVFVLDTQEIHEDFSTDEADILFYPTEKELLLAFLAAYELAAPTIVTGWNSNGFDVPYLYNRICRVLGSEEANRLSPIGKVKYSDRLERYRMAGVSSLDYLELYRKFTYTQRPNYRLDTIGRLEVDMGKVDYVGSLDMLFRNDIHKFIEYNLQDVRIIVELDKKLKLIELVRGICHIGHVPYEDYAMSSRFLEGTVVTYLHRKGIVVTNKPYEIEDDTPTTTVGVDDEDDEGFIGAYVKEPIPGLYDWVYSLDLESLYPSIIMSLNISPETKVGYVRNFNVEQHIRKEILAYVVQEPNRDDTVEMEYKEFTEFLDENSLRVASNGVLYNNAVKGIIPEILEEWFKLRKEYKNLMIEHANAGNKELEGYYDQRQHIQKIFLNSMYGYLGLVGARFYDLDNASAVTLTGQDVIKSSALFANKQYQQKLKELIEIEVDDGTVLRLHEHTPVTIIRDSSVIVDIAKNLLETDDLLAIENTYIQNCLEWITT